MTVALKRFPQVSFWFFALVFAVVGLSPSHAQETNSCSVRYQDADGNARPDTAAIQCPYAGDIRDTVFVYDRAGNMQATGLWETSVDFEDDLWVFDAGGDGTANLIIDFHRDESTLVADLYDDQDGDGVVAYRLENGVPHVTESTYWTVRVVAPDGWWQSGNTINFNLNLLIDGQVNAQFAADAYFSEVLPRSVRENVRNDGTVEFEIAARDINFDGRPDYDLRQLYLPVPDSWSILRTSLMVNSQGDEDAPGDGAIFWPYLGSPVATGLVQDYLQNPAPIQVDWNTGKIVAISEFVASRANDHNWFIYSQARFGREQGNYADFENPFAFYDLAEDQDGFPELAVRTEYFDAGDRIFVNGESTTPIAWVRYSWDQDNSTSWDYKLGLIGRHAITSTVEFPEFSVISVPYETLPYWTIGQRWDAALFVAVESNGYWTSEGIYEWDVTRDLRDEYITGLADTFDRGAYANIRAGHRGEYSFEYGSQPYLYFSPVDGKLHLRGAQGGLWNLDDNSYIEFQNLDGDSYIDYWRYFEGDEPRRLLAVRDNYIVYGGADEVVLLRTQAPAMLFETLPPRDHEEWAALGREMERNRRDFAPGDFRAMIDQFEGPMLHVQRAALRDFRLTEQGFRFVLILQPDYQWDSDFSIEGELNLAPGTYVVQSGANGLSITTLTPPAVSVNGIQALGDRPEIIALETVPVNIILENTGLQDIHDLPVRLYAEKDEQQTILEDTTVDLLALETVHVPALWTPTEAGEWKLRLVLALDETPETFRDSAYAGREYITVVSVHPEPEINRTALLSLDGSQPLDGLFILVFLGAVAIIATGLFLMIIHDNSR